VPGVAGLYSIQVPQSVFCEHRDLADPELDTGLTTELFMATFIAQRSAPSPGSGGR
jgi:hypothetical protein